MRVTSLNHVSLGSSLRDKEAIFKSSSQTDCRTQCSHAWIIVLLSGNIHWARLLWAQHWGYAPSEPPIYSAQRRTLCVLGEDTRKSRKVPRGGDYKVVSWRPEGDMGLGHFYSRLSHQIVWCLFYDFFSALSLPLIVISTQLHLSRNSGLLHSLGNSQKQSPLTGTMDGLVSRWRNSRTHSASRSAGQSKQIHGGASHPPPRPAGLPHHLCAS